MKFIFDFDDVLFNNTSQFKPYMYAVLERAGVPRAKAEKYYQTVREDGFSLRAFIKNLFVFENIGRDIEEVYREIMTGCSNFLNERLIEAVKRVGLENCYIVTNGEKEFNKDKLVYSGIWDFLGGEKRVKIVPESKREAIIKIRTSKLPDPKITPNVGSYFTNPILEQAEVLEMKNKEVV